PGWLVMVLFVFASCSEEVTEINTPEDPESILNPSCHSYSQGYHVGVQISEGAYTNGVARPKPEATDFFYSSYDFALSTGCSEYADGMRDGYFAVGHIY
ncbi:MAG: hypothetical protein AAGA66_17155, partial [Bacteroidota bacterium]